MEIVHHFPPELTLLLIDTIPRLCRSKQAVLLFFQGAGVPRAMLSDLEERVRTDRENISKFEIVREVLRRLNEAGEPRLRERREVLRRVTQFEDFSTCWDNERLQAQGLVARIRDVVKVKDSFTRMEQEAQRERRDRQAARVAVQEAAAKKQSKLRQVHGDLCSLVGMHDRNKRGKLLEQVLNRLFREAGIAIRSDFILRHDETNEAIEQVDGVIELDGHPILVEMKWWAAPLGTPEVSVHLVRIFSRAEARGLIISASRFTGPAIETAREALRQRPVTLCELRELVHLLEHEKDLAEFIREKFRAAIVEKNPLADPFRLGLI